MLPVRDDMPLPKRQRERKYPFNDLEVGQYFFVPNFPAKSPLAGIGNKRYAPKRFQQRLITVDGVPGLGVWRVE